MKASVAGLGSLVTAIAAVVGSVALSLLILHPPSESLLPWSAPADGGHVAAVILPGLRVARAAALPQVARPLPAPVEATPVSTHKASRPAARPVVPTHHPTPAPPATPAPTAVSQPVTTPVPTPPVSQPAVVPTNGRWSVAAQITSWKGAAVKQATRVVKGKPSWAGPKPNAPAPTVTVPAQAMPQAVKIPPGQAETKTPPGQAKKAR